MALPTRADTLAELLHERGAADLALAAEHPAGELASIANGRFGRLP